ncbi:MAG TPA: type II secretion system protein N [Ramlibacter sp.]|nr:type II secretion system protein N [Ramlibacter sp.]
MLMPSSASWTVRGATFALWLLAAASGVYWAMQLGGGASRSAPPPAAPRPLPAMDPEAVAGLLGGGAALPAAGPVATLASRLQLVGVVAGVRSGGGAAVISVDGKPARHFRVGGSVDEGLVLQSVQGRRAVLGPQASGPAAITLELPPIAQPSIAQPPGAQPPIAQPPGGPRSSAPPPIPQLQSVQPQGVQPQSPQPPSSQPQTAEPQTAEPTIPQRPTPNPAPR